MPSDTSSKPTTCVFTHRRADVVADSIPQLVRCAERLGLELRAAPGEGKKHPQLAEAEARSDAIGWPLAAMEADSALVLAGDGTLLRVMNDLLGGPPVMGVNYGIVGYMSALGSDRLEEAVERLVAMDMGVVDLSVLSARVKGDTVTAINDIVASGGITGRIVEVAWRIVRLRSDGSESIDEMGVIPCDGMVLSTAVGSTAYNLSNGGPVMAWGVEGFVVSFIAPHTLAARPLVVAPGDLVEIEHLGRGAPLQVFSDGSRICSLDSGERLRVQLDPRHARLAVLEEPSFYARYRDNFAAQIQNFDRSHLKVRAAKGKGEAT